MYEAIKGILKEKTPQKAVVETTGGIFYRLMIPLNTYSQLPILGAPIHLFLSYVVREDSETLYAFIGKEERDLFEVLITISGIGPKTALGIVGHMDIDTFQRSIMSSNTALLSKIPGIGKKTAERLVLEMKGQLKGKSKDIPSTPGLMGDAMQALVHLGYSLPDAKKGVQLALQEKPEEMDLSKLITSALQKMH